MGAKVTVFVMWILFTLGIISMGTSMITLSDTLTNIAGIFVIVIWGVLSFSTDACSLGTDVD
ncbi:hypothetical protein [Prevotella intermedia]|uniref:hypothetical protein n=1 Tax=Prevotella intermedia TaxID=28131 RepID=UPI0012FF42AF|nr:hypothetical protein [Prevotella intermedia]